MPFSGELASCQKPQAVLLQLRKGSRGDVALDIGVRDMPQVDERHGVRYYKSVRIGEQPRRIVVTFEEILANRKGRAFDISTVEAVVHSAANPGQDSEVLLDDFRLDR